MATGAPVVSHAEPVMGTVVSFAVVPGARHGNATAGAIDAACAALHRADAIFSTWDPQSPVSRLREGTATLGEAFGGSRGTGFVRERTSGFRRLV